MRHRSGMMCPRPRFRSPLLGLLGGLASLVALPASGLGQEPVVEERSLDAEARSELFDFLNAAGTLVIPGRTTLPAGTELSGDVAVLGGALTLAGTIRGRLVVLNGDLIVRPGARVTGPVQIIGGRVVDVEQARIEGPMGVYDEALRYTRRDGRIEPVPDMVDAPTDLGVDLGWARARFTVRSGTNYNRVEGLPVHFGPILETRGANPFRLEGFGIWRTNRGLSLSTEEMGFRVGAEQALGGRREYAAGVTVASEVAPVERWGLTDVEASFATFLLRRDYRDYYEREGWSAYLDYTPHGLPLTVRGEYRDERHVFAPVRGAWSLRSEEARPWRPQVLAAEGTFRTLGGALELDLRNDPDEPSTGWLARAELRTGVGGTLERPPFRVLDDPPPAADPSPNPEEIGPTPLDHDISFGMVDVRRYLRLGPWTVLALRGIGAGSLTGTPLPPQFQAALGGEGSLPGRPLFSGDCGARTRTVAVGDPTGEPSIEEVAHLHYGCDRLALLQAEYRGRFPIRWNPVPEAWEDEEWAGALEFQPRWALFANVGRGWTRATDPLLEGRGGTGTMSDIGAGVFLGGLGLYWALPVSGEGRSVNFFVRLTHRF